MRLIIDSEKDKKTRLELGDVVSIYLRGEDDFSNYLVCKEADQYVLRDFNGRNMYSFRDTLLELSLSIEDTNHTHYPFRQYELVLKPKS